MLGGGPFHVERPEQGAEACPEAGVPRETVQLAADGIVSRGTPCA